MNGRLVLLVGLLAFILATGLAAAALSSRLDQGPVYTLGEVQAGLAHDPAAWLHRTLRVRGIAVLTGCAVHTPEAQFRCGPPLFDLRDARPATGLAPLPLVWAGGDPLSTFLRRLPLLGSFAPAPQKIRWEVFGVYRIQLQVDPHCSISCYEALLPDTAP